MGARRCNNSTVKTGWSFTVSPENIYSHSSLFWLQTIGVYGMITVSFLHIPIIALTAYAFDEDVKQCLHSGMDAHLSKPVDIEQLKVLLGRQFDVRRESN